ncbi:MAG: HNH endonuclease [Bacteroidales bacterium]|jgi:hypothetical protein|nr:HNH endonuclease [Bacteroidales bacterium]
MVDVNDEYEVEKRVNYKGELYSVRNNGAVMRHTPDGKKTRPTDNKWTFGKSNNKTGYMEIASVRVHRIVAMAFCGEPPTKEYVVDHIDTNRQNNRPENLRWVTRLENALLNPITVKRIEEVCGSIEAFLKNPAKYRDKFPEPNFNWMCTVSRKEAQISKERLLEWAKIKVVKRYSEHGHLEKWIYDEPITMSQERSNSKDPLIQEELPSNWNTFGWAETENDNKSAHKGDLRENYNEFYYPEEKIYLTDSLTDGAVQRKWKTPSEFPNTPDNNGINQLLIYAKKLIADTIFSKNQYGEDRVVSSVLINDKQSILVWTKNMTRSIKPYALAKITYVNGKYEHESISTFFSAEGAEKQYTILQGLEWTGVDPIDDYM